LKDLKFNELLQNWCRYESRSPPPFHSYFPANVHPAALDLLKQMLIINPEERITAEEMYSLPYLKEKYEAREADDPMKSVIKLREIMTQ